MLERVKRYINENNMLLSGDKVIVALSGGPDSVALLHILSMLKNEFNIELTAAHLNHRLRLEANEEENFVGELCKNWGIPFYSRAIDVKKAARESGKSLEEAARDCRYDYLNQLCRDIKAHKIATAHHANDNAETVLMHILRGSGIRGIRGILPVNGILIRPLLSVCRADIESYIKNYSLPFRIDRSNYDTRFLRNRIRHELLPYLQQEFNPGVVEALNRLGETAREEFEVIEEDTRSHYADLLEWTGKDRAVVDNRGLKCIPLASRRRVLLQVLAGFSSDYGWSSRDIEIIMDMSRKSGSSKRVRLRQNLWVYKVYDALIFQSYPEEGTAYCYRAKVPGSIYIKETGAKYSFSLLERADFEQIKSRDDLTCLDYDKIPAEIELRSRLPGDRFYLPGMKGRQKVKDFFINRKIAAFERNNIPLLAYGSEVYAIIGYYVSGAARIDKKSRNIMVIRRELEDKTN